MTSEEVAKRRGAFILLEGLDRSGKTTQVSMLEEQLKKSGLEAKKMRFPDRETEIGKMINAYLTSQTDTDDYAIHLLFAANRWEKAEGMKKALEAGITLIVDRYSYSGVAFSAAKGLDRGWCFQPEIGLPSPDLVLFLQVPAKEAAKRGGFGEERYEKKEIQAKVAFQFECLRGKEWETVDASGTPEEVHERIKALVMPAIEAAASTPIKYITAEDAARVAKGQTTTA